MTAGFAPLLTPLSSAMSPRKATCTSADPTSPQMSAVVLSPSPGEKLLLRAHHPSPEPLHCVIATYNASGAGRYRPSRTPARSPTTESFAPSRTATARVISPVRHGGSGGHSAQCTALLTGQAVGSGPCGRSGLLPAPHICLHRRDTQSASPPQPYRNVLTRGFSSRRSTRAPPPRDSQVSPTTPPRSLCLLWLLQFA